MLKLHGYSVNSIIPYAHYQIQNYFTQFGAKVTWRQTYPAVPGEYFYFQPLFISLRMSNLTFHYCINNTPVKY